MEVIATDIKIHNYGDYYSIGRGDKTRILKAYHNKEIGLNISLNFGNYISSDSIEIVLGDKIFITKDNILLFKNSIGSIRKVAVDLTNKTLIKYSTFDEPMKLYRNNLSDRTSITLMNS
jgi:hypothetical protein